MPMDDDEQQERLHCEAVARTRESWSAEQVEELLLRERAPFRRVLGEVERRELQALREAEKLRERDEIECPLRDCCQSEPCKRWDDVQAALRRRVLTAARAVERSAPYANLDDVCPPAGSRMIGWLTMRPGAGGGPGGGGNSCHVEGAAMSTTIAHKVVATADGRVWLPPEGGRGPTQIGALAADGSVELDVKVTVGGDRAHDEEPSTGKMWRPNETVDPNERVSPQFQGVHVERYNVSPGELDAAQLWEAENCSGAAISRDPGAMVSTWKPELSLLGRLLSQDEDKGIRPSDRDWLVAATVVQWLGSVRGRTFLAQLQVAESVRENP